MKTRNKIIILVAFITLCFVIFFILYLYIQKKQNNIFVNFNKFEQKTVVESVLKIKRDFLTDISQDSITWNEILKFIDKEDTIFVKKTLVPFIKNYRINAIWVFDANKKLRFYLEDYNNKQNLKKSITPKVISLSLYNSRNTNFHLLVNDSILEIAGSINILPKERYEAPIQKWYIYVGKLWNDDLIADMQNLTGSEVTVIPFNKEMLTDTIATGVYYTKNLYDFNTSGKTSVYKAKLLPRFLQEGDRFFFPGIYFYGNCNYCRFVHIVAFLGQQAIAFIIKNIE
jgi:sensor domain CHASE-containing protein